MEKSRQQRIDIILDRQIGMLDGWMRDTTVPYADWEFDGLNLFVYTYVWDYYPDKASIPAGEGPYKLETYTLEDLSESVTGFKEAVAQLTGLGYYKEVVNE